MPVPHSPLSLTYSSDARPHFVAATPTRLVKHLLRLSRRRNCVSGHRAAQRPEVHMKLRAERRCYCGSSRFRIRFSHWNWQKSKQILFVRAEQEKLMVS